jgi:hypothetical protein
MADKKAAKLVDERFPEEPLSTNQHEVMGTNSGWGAVITDAPYTYTGEEEEEAPVDPKASHEKTSIEKLAGMSTTASSMGTSTKNSEGES